MKTFSLPKSLKMAAIMTIFAQKFLFLMGLEFFYYNCMLLILCPRHCSPTYRKKKKIFCTIFFKIKKNMKNLVIFPLTVMLIYPQVVTVLSPILSVYLQTNTILNMKIFHQNVLKFLCWFAEVLQHCNSPHNFFPKKVVASLLFSLLY